jgi:hypothetical protein
MPLTFRTSGFSSGSAAGPTNTRRRRCHVWIAKTVAECSAVERALLGQRYELSTIRAIRWPFKGNIVLVVTEERIEELTLILPCQDEPEGYVGRPGGMDRDQLETVRIVTEARLEPDRYASMDPPVLAALGLTPEFLEEVRAAKARSGKRFFEVIVQLVGHDGIVGMERTIGYYEESGFVADSHDLADKDWPSATNSVRIHPEQEIRSEAEAVAQWIDDHR